MAGLEKMDGRATRRCAERKMPDGLTSMAMEFHIAVGHGKLVPPKQPSRRATAQTAVATAETCRDGRFGDTDFPWPTAIWTWSVIEFLMVDTVILTISMTFCVVLYFLK